MRIFHESPILTPLFPQEQDNDSDERKSALVDALIKGLLIPDSKPIERPLEELGGAD